mmetsp:Transcript_402/g.1075  ORF Transcript_402/g.1075 Transcript_402/m.1075 type:complete len:228 (+) Transcript_402:176-859(+)
MKRTLCCGLRRNSIVTKGRRGDMSSYDCPTRITGRAAPTMLGWPLPVPNPAAAGHWAALVQMPLRHSSTALSSRPHVYHRAAYPAASWLLVDAYEAATPCRQRQPILCPPSHGKSLRLIEEAEVARLLLLLLRLGRLGRSRDGSRTAASGGRNWRSRSASGRGSADARDHRSQVLAHAQLCEERRPVRLDSHARRGEHRRYLLCGDLDAIVVQRKGGVDARELAGVA